MNSVSTPPGLSGVAKGVDLAGLPREVLAGLVAALSAITSCFAYGALIFSGPLHPYLSEGIAASLMTCAATALVIALTSGFRSAIAAPPANVSALLAVMMIALGPAIVSAPADQKLALANTALFAATIAAAAALLLVGFLRAGTLVRFVPYPVIAGFMGATGWLIISGAIKMTTDVPVDLSAPGRLAHEFAGVELLLLVAWTGVLWALTRKIKHPLALPILLIAAAIATNLALPVFGMTSDAPKLQSLFFSVGTMTWTGIPAFNGDYFATDWNLLVPVAGTIGAVVLITALQALFVASGLELSTRTEIDLDRELRSGGWANLASAALGGYVGVTALSATAVNRAAGGTSRLTGIVVSLAALVCLYGAGGLLGYTPRFVLGGALLLQGVILIEQWVLKTYKTLPRTEWLLVIAIIIIAAWFGFIPAEFGGLLVACVFFALNVSRIDVAKPIYGLDARTSSSMRSEHETQCLAQHGARVQVMELRGFMFFGSANRLREKVKALIAEKHPRMVIFDFGKVIGVDSSAVTTMIGISRALADKRIEQCFVAMSPAMDRGLREAGGLDKGAVILSDIDEALEHGERAVLAAYGSGSMDATGLRDWLSESLGGAEHAATLQNVMTRGSFERGDYLCRQGDATNELFLIESGRVSAVIEKAVRAPTRVRGFGPNTIVGEIAFILNVPRTASLRVDEAAVVWSLNRQAFDRLVASDPNLVFALMQNMLRIQVERLSFATRQIAALQA
jgi:SulP family sulfate permease